MPSAHNGYLDTILDTGYIGLVLFLVFIFTTLHAIGRVADRDPVRAWLLLSIALFIVLVNFLESRLDAAVGMLVVDVCGCRCRSWPILAAFSSRLGGRRADPPEASHCRAAPGYCQSGRRRRAAPTPGHLHVTPPSNQGGGAMSAAPASASPPPNLHGHMPALDGVRGLAILMVLLDHFIG